MTREAVTNHKDRQAIIEFIYDHCNLNRFRYTLISTDQHLEFLKTNRHFVMHNFISKSYLLVFLHVNGTKRAVLIDRKTLDYQPKNIQDVVRKASLFFLRLGCPPRNDIFRGTILDVKFGRNDQFMVYNVFMLKGNDFSNESTEESHRLLNEEQIPFLLPSELGSYEDINAITSSMKKKKRISGLVFIPRIPGNHMIFIKPKEEEEEDAKTDKHQSTKPVVITTRLSMKKHDSIPDVYYIKPNGQQKETLAYIPNIITSQRCESWFTTGKNIIQAEFEYLDAIDKWIPVSL